MEKSKRKIDESEYQTWYWHPASGRWLRHKPQTKAQKKQINTEAVYTQEELIRDLQNVFCTGRYRSWKNQKVFLKERK